MDPELNSSSFEHFPEMNRLLRKQLLGRTVVDLMVEENGTIIALDNGALLQVPGFAFEFGKAPKVIDPVPPPPPSLPKPSNPPHLSAEASQKLP